MPVDNLAISRSIVKLRATVPENAFTAGILGSERVGNGIVINSDGLILTIGYLITEATDVWLTVNDGREVAGHALAYDQVSGFGLVLPLLNPEVAPLEFGSSAKVRIADHAQVVSCPDFGTHYRCTLSGGVSSRVLGSICSTMRYSRRPRILIGPVRH